VVGYVSVRLLVSVKGGDGDAGLAERKDGVWW
jgi:hypothetical protein